MTQHATCPDCGYVVTNDMNRWMEQWCSNCRCWVEVEEQRG